MTRVLSLGTPLDINAVADGTLEEWTDTITISKVLVGGVMEVRVTHPDIVAQIGEVKYYIPAATKSVNTVDVASSTTYHCYYQIINGTPTWVASTTNPDATIPEVEDYVWIRQIRFKSVGGTATIEFVQRQIMAHEDALHSLSDGAYMMPPMYVSGFAPTFNLTTGVLDVEEGYYRRLTGDLRTRAAITAGVIYEPAVDISRANFAQIVKYSDGSAVNVGKFFKLLVGVLVNANSDYDFIVNIQAPPLVEYTSAAEAWADGEHKASAGFSSLRRSAVLPLCWVVMKKGDASTIEYSDIRETGLVSAAGGTAGVTSHSALANLTNYADHPGFLLADGTRPLTGNLAVDALVTIDGVDIGAHAANTEAHHATVTLGATATPILGLSTQEIGFDTQAKNTVLAGPASGADAAPTFRTISSTDISDFATAVPALAPAVTLAASATPILGLSTQDISFDTQSANTVLAGPTSGVAAAPTFRTISSSDISDFSTAVTTLAPAVTLAASATGLMDLTTQQISLDTQTASTVLAGPVAGAAAATPTFRQLNIQDIARPSGTLTLSNGVNNNVTLTAGTRVYAITGPTAAFSITGFTGGTDGSVLYIYNPTAHNMTLTAESASSDAANRLVVTNNTNSTNGPGIATFVYIAGTINRWIMAGISV